MKFVVTNNTDSPIKYGNEIQSLCNFAQGRLGFKKPPTIFLDHDKGNASSTLAKTGYYSPETAEIHVFATNRHPKDILRSIAHELVHHGQHMKGELDLHGYSGKGYAQKNPKLRRAEMEANDPMLFRDWEDSIKEKENTIYNERRNRKMSIKDWKNKELSENLSRKWGFKMDLGKLNEGMGAPADDPMGGMQAQEMMPEPPMSDMELALNDCMEVKMSQGMSMDEAKFACMREMEHNKPAPMGERDPMMPFQEGKEITHMCALEVIHKKTGKKGHPIAHTLSESGHISHYTVEFSDVIVEHIPVNSLKIMVQEEHSHKRDDVKDHDKDKQTMTEEERERMSIGGDKEYLQKLLSKYGADAKIGDVAKKEKDSAMKSEGAKPDFPDVDGDGDREEPISKAQKDKKEKGGQSDASSKETDTSKMPKGLADYHKNKKKKVDEASTMASGAVQGHAGKRRRK